MRNNYEEFVAKSHDSTNPRSISFLPMMSELMITWIGAPPIELVHFERIVNRIVPNKNVGKCNTKPIGTFPIQTVSSGGDLARLFVFMNSEAPRKFPRKGQPEATTWLTEMSC